jgi:CheY-like chemotaxis protein
MKSPFLLLLTNICAHRIDDIERGLDPEDSFKVISQKTKVKDLYIDLLKSSRKEIMLIFPTNKAFERQERIGIIGLIKQVAREKDLRVRVLVPVENLENSQELVQEPFPLIRLILEGQGFKVYCFTDPTVALRQFAKEDPSKYDLVVMDIRMPQLNGLQLYQRLKAINSSVRILFVTALDAAVELISVLPDIEINRVIMKPVSRDRFLKYVKLAVREKD